jgi:hypothetical protein
MSISPQGSIATPVTLQIQLQSPNTSKPPVPTVTPDQFSLADKKEIHEAKIMAPLLWTLTGIVPYLINRQPQKIEASAQVRSDVLNKKRSLESGKRLEKEKKDAALKAVLLPTAVGTVTNTFVFYHIFSLLSTKPEHIAWKKHFVSYMEKHFKPVIPSLLGIVLIPLAFVGLTSLAYKYFEKPESPDFNKQL